MANPNKMISRTIGSIAYAELLSFVNIDGLCGGRSRWFFSHSNLAAVSAAAVVIAIAGLLALSFSIIVLISSCTHVSNQRLSTSAGVSGLGKVTKGSPVNRYFSNPVNK